MVSKDRCRGDQPLYDRAWAKYTLFFRVSEQKRNSHWLHFEGVRLSTGPRGFLWYRGHPPKTVIIRFRSEGMSVRPTSFYVVSECAWNVGQGNFRIPTRDRTSANKASTAHSIPHSSTLEIIVYLSFDPAIPEREISCAIELTSSMRCCRLSF